MKYDFEKIFQEVFARQDAAEQAELEQRKDAFKERIRIALIERGLIDGR